MWFDDLDKILGTNPVVDPVDVVESYAEPMESSSAGPDSANTHDVPNGNGENITYCLNYTIVMYLGTLIIFMLAKHLYSLLLQVRAIP